MTRDKFTWAPVRIDTWDQVSKELQVLPKMIVRKRPRFSPTVYLEDYRPYVPSLFEWFDRMNLRPKVIAYVEQSAHTDMGIHSDLTKPNPDNYDPELALNLPIQGCESAYTVIYRSLTPPSLVSSSSSTYHAYNFKDLIEIDRYSLTEPVLLRVKHPHGVKNPTDHDRHSISVRFCEDPWFLVDN
jgi:hypothetical protein